MPAIIGMILAGVLVGPHGIHLLNYDSSFELFGKVGLYYIMFLASLEMNLQEFKQMKKRAFTLGFLSFICPMILGFICNQLILGFSVAASVIVASVYASHTLISYPIATRYGLARHKSVNIAVGATIVADTLTLLILASVTGLYKGETTGWYWILLFVRIALVSSIILFVFPCIGRYLFRRHNESVVQYIFILVLLFFGAGLMELAGMEGILGAFLTGLALNRLIPPSSPLMNHVEFVGNALFIPYLLIGVGMIIDLKTLYSQPSTLIILGLMVVIALISKWLAAFITQKLFKMATTSRNLIFGLTSSHAAATLAIVLVGHNIILPDGSRLIDDVILNGAMMLILFSCIVSSIVTERTARKIALSEPKRTTPLINEANKKMLVALSNPETAAHLIHLALTMRRAKSDVPIIALNVVLEDKPEARTCGKQELEQAVHIASGANVPIQTQSRWSVNLVSGIYHAMMESDTAELLIGLHQKKRISESFYGKFSSDLLSTVQRQITIYRPTIPINTIRHIHIVITRKAEFEAGFSRWAVRMAIMAEQLSCPVSLHSSKSTMKQLTDLWEERKYNIKVNSYEYSDWGNMISLADKIKSDHMLVFVSARENTLSYHNWMAQLPKQIERYFSSHNLMIIFPDQYEAEGNKTLISSGE